MVKLQHIKLEPEDDWGVESWGDIKRGGGTYPGLIDRDGNTILTFEDSLYEEEDSKPLAVLVAEAPRLREALKNLLAAIPKTSSLYESSAASDAREVLRRADRSFDHAYTEDSKSTQT